MVATASVYVLLAVAAHVVLAGVVTALFLGAYPPAKLPALYAVGAVLGVAVSTLYSYAVGKIGRAAETVGALAVFAASLVAARLALGLGTPWLVFALHPWCTVVSLTFIVQAFTLVNDCLDSGQAKRLFPLVGVGGTVGALVGGGAMTWLAGALGTANLLYLAAGLVAACAVWARAVLGLLPRRAPATATAAAPAAAGFVAETLAGVGAIARDRLLRLVALGAACALAASTLLKFELELELQRNLSVDGITAFLGTFNLAANAAVLFVQAFVENRLLRRFGLVVGLASMPLVLGAGAGALLVVPGLWTVAAVKFLESVARFSIAKTGDELVVVPLPSVAKRKARLIITGALAPLSVLLASLLIQVLGRAAPQALVALAAVAGAVGVWAAVAARGPYVDKLRDALQRRRLKLDDAPGLAGVTDGTCVAVIERGLASADADERLTSLAVVGESGLAVHRPAIERLYGDGDARVRAAAADAAAAIGHASWAPALAALATDDDADVRGACVRALRRLSPGEHASRVAPLLDDPTPAVRAEAAAHLAGDPRAAAAIAGLTAGPPDARRWGAYAAGEAGDVCALAPLLDDVEPEVRAAAVRAAGVLADPGMLAAVVAALGSGHTARAALEALARFPTAAAVSALVAAFDAVTARGPQRVAIVTALGALADPAAAEALAARLPGSGGRLRNHILRSLALHRARGVDLTAHRPVLEDSIHDEAARLRRYEQLALLIDRDDVDPGARRVVLAELAAQRPIAVERVFRLLGLLHQPRDLHRAWLSYTSGDRRARAFALEVVANAVDGALARAVLPYLDGTPLSDGDAPSDWRAAIRAAPDRWLRWLALYLCDEAPTTDEELSLMSTLEEIYVLRTVDLFSELSLDQLRAIADISEETAVGAGAVLFRQGDPGDTFYIVLRGEVRVERDGAVVATLGDRSCFGEMALLDSGLRTATVTATADCELSVLAGEDFHDLLDEYPGISHGMLRILARRLAARPSA